MIQNLVLIDDDEITIFVNKTIIEQTKLVENIITFSYVSQVIEFLKTSFHNSNTLPEIIVFGINEPVENSWELIGDFVKHKPELFEKMGLFLLSPSIADHDILTAKNIKEVDDYIIKPLTPEKFGKIIKAYKEKNESTNFTQN